MDSPRTAKSIFSDLAGLGPEARRRALEALGLEPELKREVQSLLAHHDLAGRKRWLEAGPPRTTPFGEHDPAPADLPAAARLDEFEVLREVGRGGMGIVYLARDTRLDRAVALKTLHARPDDLEALARFRNEAQTLARMEHEAIVPVYRVGEAEGRHYIAMQYVAGETLADRIRRERAERTEGAFANTLQRQRELALLTARLADGLEHAHQLGVVHRDVKPENVLVDPDGLPHLTDFGVARALDAERLTITGQLTGTCAYMSPEQAEAREHVVDHRSDVYSAGVVLYEALCLDKPFDGASIPEILAAVKRGREQPLRKRDPSIEVDLATICHKALERSPTHRYQSAGHLAADLRAFVTSHPILARPAPWHRKLLEFAGQHRVALLVLLSLAGSGTAGWLYAEDAARRAAALARIELTTNVADAKLSVEQYLIDEYRFAPLEVDVDGPGSIDLEPGLYRLLVRDDARRFHETTVDLRGAGQTVPVHLVLQASPDVTAGMLPIPAQVHTLGHDESWDMPFDRPRRVELPAFAIDRTEVSNAEYRQFVEATGARAPETWSDPYDPALDDLPVVDVTRDEAEAYARWRGKRLPTYDEWEAAARYAGLGLWPWGDGPAPATRVKAATPSPGRTAQREAYLLHARPVTSQPELATPEGLFHMLTNVAELTADIDFQSRHAMTKGESFEPSSLALHAAMTATLPGTTREFDVGFRCVRRLTAP